MEHIAGPTHTNINIELFIWSLKWCLWIGIMGINSPEIQWIVTQPEWVDGQSYCYDISLSGDPLPLQTSTVGNIHHNKQTSKIQILYKLLSPQTVWWSFPYHVVWWRWGDDFKKLDRDQDSAVSQLVPYSSSGCSLWLSNLYLGFEKLR